MNMISENRLGLSILFFVGGLLLIVGSGPSITGASIGASLQPLSGLASGIALILGSVALFAGIKKKV